VLRCAIELHVGSESLTTLEEGRDVDQVVSEWAERILTARRYTHADCSRGPAYVVNEVEPGDPSGPQMRSVIFLDCVTHFRVYGASAQGEAT